MKLTKKGFFAAVFVAACGLSCLFRVAAAAENDNAGTEGVSPTPVLSGGQEEQRLDNSVISQVQSVWILSTEQMTAADTDYVLTVENYVEIDGKFVELPEGSVSVSGGESVCVTPTPVPSAGE